ncbi:Ig-like domain-containing protein [Actinomycetospora endophytica]|uniref:Ig-like domain-containing protein n=1 Tax=Actinomycetospora endophytica TaxID=2291215 RepID=A0ABS8PEW9_9PSEU|nr:Ig-like domain-containing protein [Actinomycetospora endophytica]MCD2195941.1 Ig-like domain-containing protein [Actinomycetospora endophytica]
MAKSRAGRRGTSRHAGDHAWRTAALLGAVVTLVLGVAACSSSSASPGSAASPAASAGAPTSALPPPGPRVTVDPAADVNPATPVHVHADGGRITSVHMTNPTGAVIDGTTSPDGATWTTSEPLAYGRTYTVVADAVSAQGAPTHLQSTVATLAPKQTDTAAVDPGATNVGVGQPLAVTFSHPVTDKDAAVKALSVTSTPAQPGAWHWISSTQVDYRPQAYWKPGTTLALSGKLLGAQLGGGAYGAKDINETFHVHDAWVAKADGGAEQMQIFDNGALVKTMKISLGSPQFPTHTGTHVISDKQPSIVMDSATYGVMPGQPGYYKETVALDERISNDGEFVHSAPWSVGQQGSDNVSHGCVNLSPADAQWFFDHFGVGDVVEIANSGGPTLPIYDRWGDWAVPWQQWQASTT